MGTPILPFERAVLELERKAEELERLARGDVDFAREVARLRQKASTLLRKGLDKLDPWQLLQLARHPLRPSPRDLLSLLFEGPVEIEAGDGPEGVVSALGELSGRSVVSLVFGAAVRGDGREAGELGLASLHVARRAVALSERLRRPLVTLIDLVDGSPADASGAAGALEVGRLALALAECTSPAVTVVTGAATGPLAHTLMGADAALMMRYALLGGFDLEEVRADLHEREAPMSAVAELQLLSADKALDGGFVDGVVDEPEGGAHRDPRGAGEMLRASLEGALGDLLVGRGGEGIARRGARRRGPRGYKER